MAAGFAYSPSFAKQPPPPKSILQGTKRT
ncbi:MAG: hypothetical protein IMHGJWDQ_001886 [Candidatus Fervidibacter sp.]